VALTSDERAELERPATSRTIRAEDAKRAKVILTLAHDTLYSTIDATLWCYHDYINRWRRRSVARRLIVCSGIAATTRRRFGAVSGLATSCPCWRCAAPRMGVVWADGGGSSSARLRGSISFAAYGFGMTNVADIHEALLSLGCGLIC